MEPRFGQFIRERQFLHNVTPATLEWYKHGFKWLPSESPSQDDLKDTVVRMREKGLKATGCNSAIAVGSDAETEPLPRLFLKEGHYENAENDSLDRSFYNRAVGERPGPRRRNLSSYRARALGRHNGCSPAGVNLAGLSRDRSSARLPNNGR